MSNAHKQFHKNIESLMVLDSIYQYLGQHAMAFDVTEILRAEFVLLVSTMDHYIHEIVREGFLEALEDHNVAPKLAKVSIPLLTVKVLLNTDDDNEKRRILDASIRETLSKNSYQSSRNIGNALGLIGYRKVWSKLCDGTDVKPKDAMDQLDLIIQRRNKIAHESDIDFQTREKIAMNRDITKSCLAYITWLVGRIDLLVTS